MVAVYVCLQISGLVQVNRIQLQITIMRRFFGIYFVVDPCCCRVVLLSFCREPLGWPYLTRFECTKGE